MGSQDGCRVCSIRHCEEAVLCHDIRMTGLAFIDTFLGGLVFVLARRHITLHQSDQHLDFLSDCMILVGWSSHGHWYW